MKKNRKSAFNLCLEHGHRTLRPAPAIRRSHKTDTRDASHLTLLILLGRWPAADFVDNERR